MSRLILVIAMSFGLAAQITLAQATRDPASQAEIDEVWNLSGLQSEDRDDVVFEVWREYTNEGGYRLLALFQLRPIFVQSEMCMAQDYQLESERLDHGLFWYPAISLFFYWLSESAQGCDIGFERPGDAVRSFDVVPTDRVIEIMQRSDELLQLTLEHDGGAEFRARDGTWRLKGISLNEVAYADVGIAYYASFESRVSGPPNGPSVTFTIEDGRFRILGVGMWMY
jgi:hypothetical protein